MYFVDYNLWSNICGLIAAKLILNQAQNLLKNS